MSMNWYAFWGSAGFGIAYLGYDHHLDKPIAIKECLPNDLAIRKDNTEVLAKSDTNQSDFEGETLSQRLERGGLSEAEWLQMLNPLALGLIKIHKSNLLHRDIKPANMLIRIEDDSPVLVDFGAARMAIGAHSRSITAVVTPGYAPMEQYSSKGKQGPWTDIYALGAMSYKALTGTTPPDATDRVVDDELQPISQLNPNLSPALAASIDWQGVSTTPDRTALDTSGDQAEVDPDKIDEDGNTALMGAALFGDTEIARLLEAAGARKS